MKTQRNGILKWENGDSQWLGFLYDISKIQIILGHILGKYAKWFCLIKLIWENAMEKYHIKVILQEMLKMLCIKTACLLEMVTIIG